MTAAVIYTCDHCTRPIACTVADPVCMTEVGRTHYRCMHDAYSLREEIRKSKNRREPATDAENNFEEVGPPKEET